MEATEVMPKPNVFLSALAAVDTCRTGWLGARRDEIHCENREKFVKSFIVFCSCFGECFYQLESGIFSLVLV